MHSTFLVALSRGLAMSGLLGLALVGTHARAAKPVVVAPAGHVQVLDAWIRPAVKGQSGTGGFMRLLSPVSVALVGASTPVAAMAELHQMKMEGDVMRMRPLPTLALPAGQAVELQPGGNHIMLMGLTKALKAGDKVALALRFKGADGQVFTQWASVPVLLPSQAPQPRPHDMPGGDAAASTH